MRQGPRLIASHPDLTRFPVWPESHYETEQQRCTADDHRHDHERSIGCAGSSRVGDENRNAHDSHGGKTGPGLSVRQARTSFAAV